VTASEDRVLVPPNCVTTDEQLSPPTKPKTAPDRKEKVTGATPTNHLDAQKQLNQTLGLS